MLAAVISQTVNYVSDDSRRNLFFVTLWYQSASYRVSIHMYLYLYKRIEVYSYAYIHTYIYAYMEAYGALESAQRANASQRSVVYLACWSSLWCRTPQWARQSETSLSNSRWITDCYSVSMKQYVSLCYKSFLLANWPRITWLICDRRLVRYDNLACLPTECAMECLELPAGKAFRGGISFYNNFCVRARLNASVCVYSLWEVWHRWAGTEIKLALVATGRLVMTVVFI